MTDFSSTLGYQQYATNARSIAEALMVPVDIFLALIGQESQWQPYAVGSSGEIGLTQLMQGTASELGVQAYDPVSNLTGGATYLRQQFNKFGNWRDALAAYNAGAGNIQAGYTYADKVIGATGNPAYNAASTTSLRNGIANVGAGVANMVSGITGVTVAAPGTVTAIPDSAIPSTGNPFSDWVRDQLRLMFGGVYVNVPAGTPKGSTVVGADGKPIGTVIGTTPGEAGIKSPAELNQIGLNAIVDFLKANAMWIGAVLVALLFVFLGVRSFLPGQSITVSNA